MSIASTVREYFSKLAAERRLGRVVGPVVLVAAALFSVLIYATRPQTEPQERVEKAWPVSIVVAEPRAISPTLLAYGKVESRQVANLKTSVSAPVDEVLAPEGTWVEEGDLLIRLDATELELALRKADSEYKRRVAVMIGVRNDYESARKMTAHHRELKEIADAKLERHLNLYEQRMISDAILDEVRQQASERAILLEQHLSKLANFPSLIEQHEAMVAEAKAILDKARLDVAQAEIRAPFAGRVIKTMAAPGDRIQPGEPLIQVADYDRIEIRASVPARTGNVLREQVRQGRTISALGELDGRLIELTLDRLSGNVKVGQSGLDAFFEPVADTNLDIGRVMNLSITLPPEEDVVALPIQAIYENDRVYKVEERRLVGINIEQAGDYIDQEGNFHVLVRSPELREGDRLITTQLPRAITGLLVDPIDAGKFEEALAAEPVESEGGS